MPCSQQLSWAQQHNLFLHLYLFIHYLIYSFVSIIYLFLYCLPITFSIVHIFTRPNDTVNVQSISIIVPNFPPTQLSHNCNTATRFGPHTGSSSDCQIKTTLKKVQTRTKCLLVSFLWDFINYEKLSWSRKVPYNTCNICLFVCLFVYTQIVVRKV
jgi:hypothetical protein